MEAALAHKVTNRVEAAYFRSDLLGKRRVLMQGWANYLSDGGPASVPPDATGATRRELSAGMDGLYAQSPAIRNELANRNRLSSRHTLDREHLPELGIEKYPPERATYRSIL